jgi:PAS domain S-box-containing protein
LDRKLPEGNAEEFLPRLKELSPQTEVIIATAYADMEGVVAALRHGAVDYLLKPINPDVLRAGVERIARLKKAQARELGFGRILDDSLNEIYMFDATTWKFLRVNRGARENLGFTMDELRSMTPCDIKPRYTAESFAKVIEPLQTGKQKKVQFQTVHRRKDASLYDVEVHLQLSTFESAEVFVAVVLDITERTKAEATLRESEQRLRRMVEHLPAGAVYVEGERLYINRAVESITGFKAHELKTLDDWFSTVHGRHEQQMRRLYEAAKRAGFPESPIIPIVRRDGRERLVEISAFQSQQHEVWLLHDVTEFKHAQDRAVQAERLAAIGQMVAGLAHESRNALQRIQSCTEMLELDLEGHPDAMEQLGRIQQAQDDLQKLFDEVRGYASPIQLERCPEKLPSIWREAWELLSSARRGRQVSLVEHGDGSANLTCAVDRFRLVQVFRNLMENSLAACADPVVVEIFCANTHIEDQSALSVSVRDNGLGLTQDQRTRIFDPFFTTKTQGTGLGMAIAKRIVEAHGGRIAVGDHSGTGAEIVVTLPRDAF